MRRILGRLGAFLTGHAGLLILAGPAAQAQSMIDRIVFRVPAQLVAWTGPGDPVRARSVTLAPDPEGCIAFASNAPVAIALIATDDRLQLRAVSAGRSAYPLDDGAMAAFRSHVFAQRTARLPDAARHQAVTLCLFEQDRPVPGALAVDVRIALRALD